MNYGETPEEQVEDKAITTFYLNDGEGQKECTAKRFGVSTWRVSQSLIRTGHPELACPSVIAKMAKRIQNTPQPQTIGTRNELAYIESQWANFTKSLRGEGASGNLDAFLRSASVPIGLEGDTLVLGFRFPFHMQKMEESKYRSILENKLKEVFHYPYRVRYVLLDDKPIPKMGDLIPPELIERVDEYIAEWQRIRTIILSANANNDRLKELERENEEHRKRRIELQNLLAQGN